MAVIPFPDPEETLARAEAAIVEAVHARATLPHWAERFCSTDILFGGNRILENHGNDHLVPHCALPETIDVAELDLLEGWVDAERLEDLAAGAPATPSETALWQREWLEAVFSESVATDDAFAISFVPLEGRDDTTAVCAVLVRGWSPTGCDPEIHGYFADEYDARAELRRWAYLSNDPVPDFAEPEQAPA